MDRTGTNYTYLPTCVKLGAGWYKVRHNGIWYYISKISVRKWVLSSAIDGASGAIIAQSETKRALLVYLTYNYDEPTPEDQMVDKMTDTAKVVPHPNMGYWYVFLTLPDDSGVRFFVIRENALGFWEFVPDPVGRPPSAEMFNSKWGAIRRACEMVVRNG